MERNRELYQRLGKIWIFSIFVCVVIASITGYTLSDMRPNLLVPLIVGIVFLPLIVIGTYGLRRGYSAGHWWNHIYKGGVARLVNSLWIVMYILIMIILVSKNY